MKTDYCFLLLLGGAVSLGACTKEQDSTNPTPGTPTPGPGAPTGASPLGGPSSGQR